MRPKAAAAAADGTGSRNGLFKRRRDLYAQSGSEYRGGAGHYLGSHRAHARRDILRLGLRFSGVSQSNAYGDDAQAATNYPLVAIINGASAHVFFARTHAFSSMAVASPGRRADRLRRPRDDRTRAEQVDRHRQRNSIQAHRGNAKIVGKDTSCDREPNRMRPPSCPRAGRFRPCGERQRNVAAASYIERRRKRCSAKGGLGRR
jgi:hypothetical protein